jgi:transposase
MLRTALAPISGNRRRGPELSPYQRGIICGAVLSGSTTAELTRAFNIPESTIRSTIQSTTTRRDGRSKPRSGRPSIITPRAERTLLRMIRLQPKIKYKDLISAAGVNCSRKTITRLLDKHHIRK